MSALQEFSIFILAIIGMALGWTLSRYAGKEQIVRRVAGWLLILGSLAIAICIATHWITFQPH